MKSYLVSSSSVISPLLRIVIPTPFSPVNKAQPPFTVLRCCTTDVPDACRIWSLQRLVDFPLLLASKAPVKIEVLLRHCLFLQKKGVAMHVDCILMIACYMFICRDISKVLHLLFPENPPPIVLIGHSMGGAIGVRVASSDTYLNILGLAVIDVVEGYTIN